MERSIGLDFLFTITFFAPRLDIVGDTTLWQTNHCQRRWRTF